jgi:hypothetical protein
MAPKKRKTKRGNKGEVKRPMSGETFQAWRTSMGLSAERDAAKALGMSRGFLRSCDRDGAPLYVALACAALTLPPKTLSKTLANLGIEQ